MGPRKKPRSATGLRRHLVMWKTTSSIRVQKPVSADTSWRANCVSRRDSQGQEGTLPVSCAHPILGLCLARVSVGHHWQALSPGCQSLPGLQAEGCATQAGATSAMLHNEAAQGRLPVSSVGRVADEWTSEVIPGWGTVVLSARSWQEQAVQGLVRVA